MSPRKPTIDGLDDIDDEDGVWEEEASEETDLDLTVKDPDEVALGGTASADELEVTELTDLTTEIDQEEER
jgi:hypothetical protein